MCKSHFQKKLFSPKVGKKDTLGLGKFSRNYRKENVDSGLPFLFYYYFTDVKFCCFCRSETQSSANAVCKLTANSRTTYKMYDTLTRKCRAGMRNIKTPRKSLQEPPLIKGVFACTVYPYLDVSQREDSILEHV